MSDLRVNLLALTQHVKALRLETHPTKEELDLIVREVASMSNSDVVGAMELLRVRQRE
jgi:hypothetical protein